MENKYQVEFPSTNVKNIWKHYYIVVLELISIGFNLHFSFLKNIVSSKFRFSDMQIQKLGGLMSSFYLLLLPTDNRAK